jgi:tetratricopeptide (TPR) repeat protein
VYILLYPPEKEATVKEILGPHWDIDYNRQHALEVAQADAEQNPEDAYAWFNVGTNLVYFERYREAAQAYDRARELGLPQRFLRYQFGPFFAYFHTRRMEDLKSLTDYALQITPNSEEALLWQGWMLFRNGDTNGAMSSFQRALVENPFYQDAQYAINFIQGGQ